LTIETSAFFLIATGAFAGLGALGSLLGVLLQRPTWGRVSAQLGMIGGCLFGAVLTVLLFHENGVDSTPVRVLPWTLFSFLEPRPLSLVFGLEATWLTAALVSLAGALFRLTEWSVVSHTKSPLSDDARLASCLLYAVTTSFLFAPNLAQSLLSWGAISLLTSVLIHLARVKVDQKQSETAGESSSLPKISFSNHRSAQVDRRTTLSPYNHEFPDPNGNRRRQILAHLLGNIREGFDRVWRVLTNEVLNWFGEQAEFISESSESVKILATMSGLMAVLLTWLIVIP
jgi:hypothetical protein